MSAHQSCTIEVFRLENYRNIAIHGSVLHTLLKLKTRGFFFFLFKFFFLLNLKTYHSRGGLKVTRAETGNFFLVPNLAFCILEYTENLNKLGKVQ